jgi:LysM repeat protein
MIRLKKLLFEAETIETNIPESEYELLYDGWLKRGIAAANYLIKNGFSKVHAAAFIGNFAVESGVRPNVSQNLTKGLKLGFGFKPTTPEEAKKQPDWAGYGLAQWTENRKSKLIAAGAKTTNDQLDFIISELEASEKSAWDKIKAQKTIEGATKAVVTYYERAGAPKLKDRTSKATDIYNAITTTTPKPVAPKKQTTDDDIIKQMKNTDINAVLDLYDPPTPKATTKTTTASYHTVVSGDTLSGIASKYKTSVSNLKTLNKLSSTVIKPGQKLKIK